MTVGIAAIAASLPATRVSVSELPEAADLAPAHRAVYDALGIETVSIDDARSAEDLAASAGKQVLATAAVAPDEVDAVVSVQSRVPDLLMASEATKLQADIGANRAMTFGVSDLGCVSISAGLLAGRALLESDPRLQTVLLAHGSKPPGRRRYRHPVTVSGDGGIALLLRRDAPNRIVDIALETNGEYWDLYRVDFKDRPTAEWVEECASFKTYSFKLAIESRNRFTRINEELLARHGLALSDVDHFVMQNISGGAFRFYEDLFGIKFTRSCWDNLRRFGHLGSMDIALNLHGALETGEVKRGDRILVMNNSPVAAWSTMLVEA